MRHSEISGKETRQKSKATREKSKAQSGRSTPIGCIAKGIYWREAERGWCFGTCRLHVEMAGGHNNPSRQFIEEDRSLRVKRVLVGGGVGVQNAFSISPPFSKAARNHKTIGTQERLESAPSPRHEAPFPLSGPNNKKPIRIRTNENQLELIIRRVGILCAQRPARKTRTVQPPLPLHTLAKTPITPKPYVKLKTQALPGRLEKLRSVPLALQRRRGLLELR